ncbi:hypothetical protein [Pseudolysinimonas sp.]|uniref:hypothetical protein n=1 Tax=Pseudolysinimonas sp. TaxID=2680009 RepID=UPI003F822E04
MSTTTSSAPAGIRVFNALAGVTTLAIFLQAISAGVFMSFHGSDAGEPWVTTHQIVGYVAILLAVVTAIVAIVALRKSATGLMGAAIALAVLLVAQVGIGQAIENARGLVAVHVPLAFIVFGLTIWLSVRGAVVRRRLAGAPAAA